MKLFLSWSGATSKQIAQALRAWLPAVLQATRPYFSPDDLNKGARWSSEIALELQECEVGILCITRESISAPWLIFEAGALAKSLDSSLIIPVLVGLEPSDVTGPLAQFQATRLNREEFKQTVSILNKKLGEDGLATQVLDTVFDKWWPDLESKVLSLGIQTVQNGVEQVRSDRSLLEEIVNLLRAGALQAFRSHPVVITNDNLHSLLVDQLPFTARTINCLHAEDIRTVGELLQWDEISLLKTPNFGRKSLTELKEVIGKLGLRLKPSIRSEA